MVLLREQALEADLEATKQLEEMLEAGTPLPSLLVGFH